jgi:hypothetical protein
VEWTTESEGQAPPPAYENGHDTQQLSTQPASSHPAPEEGHFREESRLPPVTNTPPPVPTHTAPEPAATSQAPTGYEQCPSCGAFVAVDQRYCLECGHRRGEPRLPFMEAVVFMDAMKRPPEPATAPTKANRNRISPNAALIAGVGTLLLALGIGVLIGRSGNHGTAASSQPPIVIKGGGGGEGAETSYSSGGGGSKGVVAGTKKKSKKKVVKEKAAAAASGKGAEEVLKPKAGVNLPPATAKVGEKCAKDVVGCNESGEFDGSFFGEE